MKLIVNTNGLETDFSELKNPVVFLDNIKKREISIEETRYKQEQFNNYLKKIIIEDRFEEKKKPCLILISFLTEETVLLSL